MEIKPVSQDTHDGRCKIEDERFARDLERIQKSEENIDKITVLTVQMGEILKQNNTRLDSHSTRLDCLEQHPAKLLDKLSVAVIGLVCSIIGGIIMFFINKR
ncbi:MAG: hypothetical protein WCN92_11895 [Eubacteriales bacterium]